MVHVLHSIIFPLIPYSILGLSASASPLHRHGRRFITSPSSLTALALLSSHPQTVRPHFIDLAISAATVRDSAVLWTSPQPVSPLPLCFTESLLEGWKSKTGNSEPSYFPNIVLESPKNVFEIEKPLKELLLSFPAQEIDIGHLLHGNR
nr:hypothetical protein Iba_chr01eCG8900 [Ipomoea batatas]